MPHVLHVLQPETGGVPTYAAELALGLLERGWEVSVAGEPSSVGVRDLPADVRRISLTTTRGASPLVDARAVRRIGRAVRGLGVDLVHGHSSKASLLCAPVARLTGRPLAYTPHGWSFDMELPLPVRAGLAGVEASLLALGGTRVITVSEAEAASARRWHVVPDGRLRVVHTGLPELPPGGGRAAARAALGVGGDEPVVAWIGRIGPQKRPEDLVAVAERLGSRATVAALVSRVDEEPELGRALDAAGVTVLPKGTPAQSLLDAADVLLMTSAWEAFPLVVLEGMRTALPVVATDVGGVGEQVDDGRTGVLRAPGDVDGLTEAVVELLGDPLRRADIGRAARERFDARFGRARMLDAIETAYGELLAADGR